MAVDLTGNPGGLFRRLGRIGGLVNSLNSFLGNGDLSAGGLVSLGVGVDNLQNEFEAARQDLTPGLYPLRDSYRTSHSQLTSYLQTRAQQVVIEMVNDDSPLSQKTLALALAELISQMTTAAASVTRPTVSATVTAGASNTGNGVCVASILGTDGKQLDYIFNESLVLKAATDAQAGTATAGQEQFNLTGAAAQTDALRWDWPLGSGAASSLPAVDAAQDNSGNVLYNSDFETWTNANIPDNWVKNVGTIGTSILRSSSPYKGSYALSFVGDGAELTSVEQTFNTTPSTVLGSGGTNYKLLPSTVYAVNAWVKVSVTPVAGVLSFALVDGSGTILNDAAGTANNVTQSLPAISTTYVNVQGFFRTPAVLPATAKLRVRLSTALSAGSTVIIDHLALAPATRAYVGGPYVALFSGATNFIAGDKFTVAVANNYSSKWAKLLERLFNLRSLGLAIPSSGAPTIADSLVA